MIVDLGLCAKKCLFQNKPEVGCTGAACRRLALMSLFLQTAMLDLNILLHANPIKTYRHQSLEINVDPPTTGGCPRAWCLLSF